MVLCARKQLVPCHPTTASRRRGRSSGRLLQGPSREQRHCSASRAAREARATITSCQHEGFPLISLSPNSVRSSRLDLIEGSKGCSQANRRLFWRGRRAHPSLQSAPQIAAGHARMPYPQPKFTRIISASGTIEVPDATCRSPKRGSAKALGALEARLRVAKRPHPAPR